MTAKQKPKPSRSRLATPSQPSPPHMEAAVARYREHTATAPPGIAIRKTESGAVEIDTDTDVQNGMIALMDAVGTRDMQFFTGYLTQIINASDTKDGTDATAVNSALGFIRGVKPQDEVEAALAAQMHATHAAVMTFARRLSNVSNDPPAGQRHQRLQQADPHLCRPDGSPEAIPQHRGAEGHGPARLSVGRRPGHRRQRHDGGRGIEKRGHNPMSNAHALPRQPPMPRQIEAHRQALPGARRHRLEGLPPSWRWWWRAQG